MFMVKGMMVLVVMRLEVLFLMVLRILSGFLKLGGMMVLKVFLVV